MKDMALWNEGDWIAAIAVVVLGIFLAIGSKIAIFLARMRFQGNIHLPLRSAQTGILLTRIKDNDNIIRRSSAGLCGYFEAKIAVVLNIHTRHSKKIEEEYPSMLP